MNMPITDGGPMRVLVTGAAGFIGFHLSRSLAAQGMDIVGIDNMNDYYPVSLKEARIAQLSSVSNFRFMRLDLTDNASLSALFSLEKFTHVVHLAAQAGVRYSLVNPNAYIQSNLAGFGHLLEACRHNSLQHLVFASSSSVYGLNSAMPFAVSQNVDHPVSLYAATKKSNELMAHVYSHLFGIPTTGLRFFTVYGPWGRPDMALYLFTEAILGGRAINVFNNGNMRRDFTYIDDVISGVEKILLQPPAPNAAWDSAHPDPSSSSAPYKIYNIGNNRAVALEHFIAVLERALGVQAMRNFLPMQEGDVAATYADVEALHQAVGFSPTTTIEEGIPLFVAWYKSYHGLG